MKKEMIVSGEKKTVLSLRKKIVGLDEGLHIYCMLDKDEEDIQIPFTLSLFVTSEKSKMLLRRYIDDLKKGVCRESLGIDFTQMSKQSYWLEKCAKLKCDMEAMGVVPLTEHGYNFTVMGFRPETTVDLYRAIEANLMEIAELTGEADRQLMAAPLTLYGNYYRYQKSLCDPQPVAMVLWEKAQRAGYVNEHYQPICSRPEAAILAFEMAKRLGIKDKWKAFEALWDRRNMYRDYQTAINQKKTLEYRDKVKAALG